MKEYQTLKFNFNTSVGVTWRRKILMHDLESRAKEAA